MRPSPLQAGIGALVLAAIAALATAPIDRGALRAQGFVRLLEADRAMPESQAGSLFATLGAWATSDLRVSVVDWRLNEPRAGDGSGAASGSVTTSRPGPSEVEALRRTLASQLAVWQAGREPGSARILLSEGAPAAEAPDVRIEIELTQERGALGLRSELRRGEERVSVVSAEPWILPTRWALAPPLLAVLAALLFGRPIVALMGGVAVGAVLLRVESGDLWLALPAGLVDVARVYFWGEVSTEFKGEILGLVLALFAMIGLLQASGAIAALVDRLSEFARSARATLGLTFGLGLLIFFDDYSNCLIVGNSMRPLADRTRVAREKLAFIVDTTAAPVAGLSLLSTWIAFEVSLYAPHLASAGFSESGYAIFVQSLPYRFYSIFALCFVAVCIVLNRDYGPMRRAQPARPEQEAPRPVSGGVEGSPVRLPGRAWHALLALASVILVTAEEILRRGGSVVLADGAVRPDGVWETLVQILFAGGGSEPLLTGALVGLGAATWLAGSNAVRAVLGSGLAAGIAGAWLGGPPVWVWGLAAAVLVGLGARGMSLPTARAALPDLELGRVCLRAGSGLAAPIGILFGAWMIASVCQDARTADLLVALLSGSLPPLGLPILLFGSAAAISFATGTSWGTMALLLPNVVALAASVGASHPVGSQGMVLISIGAVLEGAIFGDHCSPISDTTVLSSIASGSDHMAHVRTQLPYACSIAGIAIGAGYLPTLWVEGWTFTWAFAVGTLLCVGLLWGLGRTPDGALGPGALGPGSAADSGPR